MTTKETLERLAAAINAAAEKDMGVSPEPLTPTQFGMFQAYARVQELVRKELERCDPAETDEDAE